MRVLCGVLRHILVRSAEWSFLIARSFISRVYLYIADAVSYDTYEFFFQYIVDVYEYSSTDGRTRPNVMKIHTPSSREAYMESGRSNDRVLKLRSLRGRSKFGLSRYVYLV